MQKLSNFQSSSRVKLLIKKKKCSCTQLYTSCTQLYTEVLLLSGYSSICSVKQNTLGLNSVRIIDVRITENVLRQQIRAHTFINLRMTRQSCQVWRLLGHAIPTPWDSHTRISSFTSEDVVFCNRFPVFFHALARFFLFVSKMISTSFTLGTFY